ETESASKSVVNMNLLYLMCGFARSIGKSDFLINLGYSENGTDKITIYFPRQGNYKVNDFQILGQTMDGYEEGIRERKENVLRSEEHTSELQSRFDLVCRLLLEKKNQH